MLAFISLNRETELLKKDQASLVDANLETFSHLLPIIANQMCLTTLFPRHKNKITGLFYILVYLTLINRVLGIQYVFTHPADFIKRSISLLIAGLVILYVF